MEKSRENPAFFTKKYFLSPTPCDFFLVIIRVAFLRFAIAFDKCTKAYGHPLYLYKYNKNEKENLTYCQIDFFV